MINIITSKVTYNHPILSGKVTEVKTYYYDMSEISDLLDYINNLINQGNNILYITINDYNK